MSDESFETPSGEGGRHGRIRRRVPRNGSGTSANRRHQRRAPSPESSDRSRDATPSPATPDTGTQSQSAPEAGQPAEAAPHPGQPAETPCPGDQTLAPGWRARMRRLLWFRAGARGHNTTIVVAWIGFAGAVSTTAVPLMPGVVTAIVNRGGGNGGEGGHRIVTIVHAPSGVTYAYRYPSMSSPRAKSRPVYREGDTIEIVCQIRDGESVSLPGDGRPNYAVKAWDRLPNGSWVPDIFTSLEGKRGDKLPSGVEQCPDPANAPVPTP